MSKEIIDLARVERTQATLDSIIRMIVDGSSEAASKMRNEVPQEDFDEYIAVKMARLACGQRKLQASRDARVLRQLNLPCKRERKTIGKLIQFPR